MKTNIYILLILLLSFSYGNAQSTIEINKIESNKEVSVSENDRTAIVVTDNVLNIEKENEVIIISEEELKKSIARSSSDIRIYLNKKRKVENIKLLFPKINRAKKA